MKTIEDCEAFVPAPLPPKIEPSWGMVALVSEAERALGQLSGVGRMLSNPHLLIRPFVHREAVLSSRIEGTMATLEQLALFEATPDRATATQDLREVANHVRTMEYGLERLKTLPMSLRLIRELHERLLQGVRGDEFRPGEFRQNQNYIGRPGQSIQEARFVPPPITEMAAALGDFERFLHASSELPGLVQLALIHYQFEAIHPFMDGNGRIGRLLISLLTCERGFLPQPLLYLSAYFERNSDVYMDNLLRVSQSGAWSEWVTFFLRGVIEQSSDAVRRSQRLLDLREQYRSRTEAARASALLPRLVDALFAWPAITVAMARDRLGVTYPSAQHNIEKLQKVGILREVTGGQRNRVFIAEDILAILREDRA